MKKTYCRYCVIGVILGIILGGLGGIINENVKGATINYSVGFNVSEGGGAGFQFPIAPKTSIINTALKSSVFIVNTGSKRSGENGFEAKGTGYWNFSYTEDAYFTGFETWSYFPSGIDVHNENHDFYFYNSTYCNGIDISTKLGSSADLLKYITVGVRIHDQKYSGTPHPEHSLQYLNSVGSWTGVINDNGIIGGWDYFGFDIINEYGYCNYYYSANGITVEYWINDTVCNTTKIINNYRIDRCYISGSSTAYNYLDDVNITVSGSYETGGGGEYNDFSDYDPYCSGSGSTFSSAFYTVITYNIFGWKTGETDYTTQYIENQFVYPWSGTIYGIELPIGSTQYSDVSDDPNDYSLYVNGIPWGVADSIIPYGSDYALHWENTIGTTLENEKPLFSFGCSKYVTYGSLNYYWYSVGFNPSGTLSQSKGHDSIFYFVDEYLNGNTLAFGKISMCFYYNGTQDSEYKPEIPPDELEDYKTNFGNEFIQFYNYGLECYHGVGDNPYIIYNISDDYFNTNSSIYLFNIMKVGSVVPVYTGSISFTGSYQSAFYRLSDYKFSSIGAYYIVLYNTSDYGTEIKDIIGNDGKPSQAITVCAVGTGGSGNGNGETGDGSGRSTEQINFNIIIGLIFVLSVGVALAVVLGSAYGVVLGGAPVAYVLSLSALGDYQFLPTEVGYGLIVVLVLVAVIIWFLD